MATLLMVRGLLYWGLGILTGLIGFFGVLGF